MKKNDDNKGAVIIGISILGLLLLGKKSDKGETIPPGSGTGSGSTTWTTPIHDDITEPKLREIFARIKTIYGDQIAGETEQLYRKETRNFESGQFLRTYTPGMEQAKGKDSFPYGWGSLETFLQKYPKFDGDFYLVGMNENKTGIFKKFVGFPSLGGAINFVAYTISNRKHPGYWRSNDPAVADKYYTSLKTYPIKFT